MAIDDRRVGMNANDTSRGRDRVFVVVTTLVLALTCTFVSESWADGKVPSTCDTRATTPHWTNNCTVSSSSSHERYGPYAGAAQWVLSAYGGGIVDHDFGSTSTDGMEAYEDFHGRTINGVVSPSDWNFMKANSLVFTELRGSYYYFRPGLTTFGERWARTTSSNAWWVTPGVPPITAFVHMDTAD